MEMHNISTRLVAHRGYSLAYPENSLSALKAALECGAFYLEFDIQLSKDKVPYVIHDNELFRTTGIHGKVTETSSAQLDRYTVGVNAGFGDRFNLEPLPTLAVVAELIQSHAQCICFVELKRASIIQFGINSVYQSVSEIIEPIANQCVIISYDIDILHFTRQQGKFKIGWVFEQWDEVTKQRLYALQPNYAFTDYTSIPQDCENLWSGDWLWALYVIDSIATASNWLHNGAHLIETNDIGGMINKCESISE